MDGTHLMIFHIGPVQEFIASARRSHDLWFGSWLLSELSKAAALEVVRNHGNDTRRLVFPAPDDLVQLQSAEFTVPNKVVAEVGLPPAELGEAVQTAVLHRLREIRQGAYDKVKVKGDFDDAVAAAQVDDMLEFYWVASPIVDDNYSQARNRAESLMASRKVTRNFEAVTWGSSSPQSSLDGQRESVIPERVYDQVRQGQMTQEQLRRAYGVRPGERLCGVGLLKRHGARDASARFFSTSHVSAQPLLERLTDQDATENYSLQLMELGISDQDLKTASVIHPVFGRTDGHMLFEERLHEFFEAEGVLKEAKRSLREFLQVAFGGAKPLPYYALLAADGDRMGKAINAQNTSEEHRRLSQQLTRFAGKVSGIVAEHKGSLVYSGGDDVLAFVPLHTVLCCASALAKMFCHQLKAFGIDENGTCCSPTLSVGIAVAHHLDPLSDALSLARAAEKTAKSVPGKNALAITVSKRSGADLTVAGRWGKLDQRLQLFVEWHYTDAIPDGAAYQLRDLVQRLHTPDEGCNRLQEVMRKEALRVLRRKEAQQGQQPIGEDVLQKLEEFLDELDQSPAKQQPSVGRLADELILARLFADAKEQAGPYNRKEAVTP